ncbi:MAG: hypothetical protein JOZ18_20360 [Chloroflexi bacterium]|nr:hypothetical protein [Chloroflexota bacterium]
MKRLIGANPQDFLSWILQGAQFKGSMSIELRNITRQADIIFDALLNDKEIFVHFEIQSTGDEDMADRILEYNILATLEHKRRILSCVIYLREDNNIVESPLVWEMPDGFRTLRFDFIVIKLWEIVTEEIIRTGLVGLLPLLPLTKDGKQYKTVDTMIEGIVAARQFELLPLGEMLAGLVFKDSADRKELKRRFAVYHDIIEESWVYQEILQRGVEKGLQQGIQQGVQQGILKLLQKRFPETVDLARKQINSMTDPDVLQDLLFKVSIAQNAQEVLSVLGEIARQEKK